VCETDGQFDIMLASSDGSATRFHEEDVRDTGRDTGGVYGMDVEAPNQVVSLLHPVPGCDILSVCANGYGKRTPESEYRRISRGGKGVTSINTGERNGPLVACLPVQPGDDILIMTKLGQVIRTQVDQVRVVGRAGSGVTIIDLDPGDTVLAVELLPKGTPTAEPEVETPPTP
jgi:DNA gyrase subunit A